MQNEQCGLCWDLKFDKCGYKTHDQKYPRDFIPLDYCVKCKKPKFNSYGIPTHPEKNLNSLIQIIKLITSLPQELKQNIGKRKKGKKIL